MAQSVSFNKKQRFWVGEALEIAETLARDSFQVDLEDFERFPYDLQTLANLKGQEIKRDEAIDNEVRKFLADILATEVATLVPAWGLERTLDFARKLAAQQPIWCRGGTRMLTTSACWRYALYFGPNLNAIMRLQAKDPSGSLAYKFAEPIPVRIVGSTGIVHNV
jgi:hypothetical protein